MSTVDPIEGWCTRIDVVAWKVTQGEYALVGRLADLSDEAIVLAQVADVAERAKILSRLRRAADVIRAAQLEVRGRIDELPARRRAARRYVATPQPAARVR